MSHARFRLPHPAFLIAAAVVVSVEILLRLIPVQYGARSELFLIDQRRTLAEAAGPNFDYIILGDSRSMSLLGHAPTAAEPYSLYNFSIPGLGPRYFRHFLKKYATARKHMPAAVIMAADPQSFQVLTSRPYHDSALLYSDGADDSLGRYLWYRFTRRLEYALAGGVPRKHFAGGLNEAVWESFSHRYLHLFGMSDLVQQFTGAERVFVLREALPYAFYSYRYRKAVKRHTLDLNPSRMKWRRLPPVCNSCAGTYLPECYPRMSRIQENRLLEAGLRKRYGQLNVSDRIRPARRRALLAARAGRVQDAGRILEKTRWDLTELEKFVVTARELGTRVVLIDVPHVEPLRTSPKLREYDRLVQDLVAKYPHVMRALPRQRFLPVELFTELIHYECKGARLVNQDFYESVMPRILKFAPPAANRSNRGFE